MRRAIELRDRVALVTGATSGTGAACARELAGLGARLLLTGRSEARGEQLRGEIAAAGGEAAFVRGDVRDEAFCQTLVDETLRRFGRIDVPVNNAGISCARDGVRINAVCPGDTDTPMMHDDYAQRGVSVEQGDRESAAAIPMGRMATPEEVAHAVCFLASDAAAYLTGVALPIDGGNTAT